MQRPYTGTLVRRYQIDVPADPGWADPAAHRIDEGHLVDTSGRDEAPRGGGWMPMEYVTEPALRGLPAGGPRTFAETHDRVETHRDGLEGHDQSHAGRGWLAYLRKAFPARPNAPEDLDNAGAAGAAHGGLRARGMAPWMSTGRRTVDGRHTDGGVNLGHTYTHPIERVRRPLHFNRPALRRVLAPSITRERGGPSPGGYSSQYDPAASAWAAGARQPTLRRLVQAYGQREYDPVSQDPANSRAANPGPIGNGGW